MINGYVAAGYALIWAAVLWYGWRTNRRLAVAERELSALRNETPDAMGNR